MAALVQRFVASKKGAQASGVLLAALGLFLALSLLSHSEQDFPNSSRAPEESLNWGGRIGAHIAYGSFVSLGYGAYVLPLVVLIWGWNRLRQQPALDAVQRSAGLMGMALLFSIGSGLPPYSPYTAFEMGGWLGTQASNALLIPYGGRIGSGVLLSALFIAALILSTDLDPRCALRRLGRGGRALWRAGLRGWRLATFQRRREARRAAREEAAARALEECLESSPLIGNPARVEEAPQEAAPLPDAVRLRAPRPQAARAEFESAPPPALGKSGFRGRYRIPSLNLLASAPAAQGEVDKEQLLDKARILEEALANFDVSGKVVEVSPGPVVTRYEIEPAAGVKVNRIVGLADDLVRIMSARGIRIQAPVPGKSVVGVEIANPERETVYLRKVLESRTFRRAASKLSIALGKTIAGEPYVSDLATMPHLLVAGATGAGKSVCINCLISSLLFKSTPEEVRLLMVDPKVVELAMYNDIPHLLAPVVTEPKKASEALQWAVGEMEVRYRKLAEVGVRHLDEYNRKLARLKRQAPEEGAEAEKPMPYIVIIVDEFADLMLTAPADVETSIMSLAQKSRAVGIHLVLATQRPSVNVITGVIKANFPSRIAFQVASKTDSRTILDCNGAERLLGRGDMLFLPGGQGEPIRIHGAFIAGEETEALVTAIKATGHRPEEVAIFGDRADINTGRQERDELFDQALRLVLECEQASTSFLQRRMKVGYSRAGRLMDELESAGIVGPATGAKPRQILVSGEVPEEEPAD